MFKRLLAGLLACALLLLCFGCGRGKEAEKVTFPEGTKAVIFVEEQKYDPETYAAAAELARIYGESVQVLGLGADYQTDTDVISESAVAAAKNPEVKAMIFAGGVEGVCRAARMVREQREDMLIVCCSPREGNELLSHYADMTLNVDFTALADSMVQKSKELGAKTFVFYTTNSLLKYAYTKDLRSAVETACKNEKLTFKSALCVDLSEEGRDSDMAKQFIREDLARKEEKFGKETAFFCTDPTVQGVLAQEAAARGMAMVGTFMPSPLVLASGLNISLADHETDSAFAMEQLKTSSIQGHAATWSTSAPITMLKTAFAYVASVLADGADTWVDAEGLAQLAVDFAGGITFEDVYDGIFLLRSELVTL